MVALCSLNKGSLSKRSFSKGSLSKRSLGKRSLGRCSLRKCECSPGKRSLDGYLFVGDGGYTNHPSHALYKIFTVSKLE
jgi:hypothetical protein